MRAAKLSNRSLWCPTCRQNRAAEAFTWTPSKRSSYCRECQSAKHRDWRKSEQGQASQRIAARRARTVNPDKVRARNALYQEIRMGRMAKGSCELGPLDCVGRIEAHHEDYSAPLLVHWLCQRHHRAVEGKNGGAALSLASPPESSPSPVAPATADRSAPSENIPTTTISTTRPDFLLAVSAPGARGELKGTHGA